jgi:hypothetical protein
VNIKYLLNSGFVACLGGYVFIIFRYHDPGINDYPSSIEQLQGDERIIVLE